MRITEPSTRAAYQDVVYRLTEADPASRTEVSILLSADGHNATVAGKKICHGRADYEINIGPYLRRAFDVEPVGEAEGGLSYPSGRTIFGTISAPGADTPGYIAYTCGTADAAGYDVLSDAPYRHKIAAGEADEISLLTSGAGTCSCTAYTQTGRQLFGFAGNERESMLTVRVAPADLEGVEYFEVRYEGPRISGSLRRYDVVQRGEGATRLCWMNRFGALDYYTFECVDSNLKTRRQYIETLSGAEINTLAGEAHTTLASDWEEAATLRWLAQIVNSPRVWVCEQDGSYRRVEVASESIRHPEGDAAPARIEFAIRNMNEIMHKRP